ncbi:acetyltransferase-like isoleucine patch superfamily enzyme [Mycoplana sp. BE70]|uniref:CatB-related O-acetyltransferase n=1 Tax=Mycoplana sp. BE70 TaxID=2817775 RepID=UPI002861E215|nr:CatB-related O-acetyltransferase [Mycoplana sp. BE70]MDR6756721.1 acetyltransferase-like isoleucine patch superfamily enzyme [Mycoplana sp. BE70]
MAPFRKLRTRLGLRKKPAALPQGVTIGRHTYGLTPAHFHGSSFECQVHIGNFCSVAEHVVFVQMADHDLSRISSFPLARRLFGSTESNVTTKGPITVGHDVWIGRNALILSGVTIGHGAVIGAGAVVAKDVPPYGIAVGNPAQVVKYRFSPEEIALLLRVQWWSWDDATLQSHQALLTGTSEAFIEHFAALAHGADG